MLCASDIALPQGIILRLQARQCFLPFFGQIGLANGCNSVREESGLPLFALLFPLVGFLALPLFELLFQLCGFVELFAFYCGGNGGPEALRLVGELFVEWRDYFW